MLNSNDIKELKLLLRPNITTPFDARVSLPERGTETVYAPSTYSTLEEWEAVKEDIKNTMKMINGLSDYTEKCPLEPKVYDLMDCGDFTVEKLMIQSMPGYYCTGNIFRPKNKKGPFPVIINPHGHWPDGRLSKDHTIDMVQRCVNFARMGCIAILYDMVGYVDSCQTIHHFADIEMELWATGSAPMQTINSMRVLDFAFENLDIDKRYVACTGASGGGTQTYMITVLDDRITMCAPVNMISSIFQGGCFCENWPLMRVDYNNMQIASAIAPRPMLMVNCTGDWTVNTPEVEYPMLKGIYNLYGAGDNLEMFRDDFEHNYNKASRVAVADFFSRRIFGKPFDGEVEYDFGDRKLLRLFPDNVNPDAKIKDGEVFDMLKGLRRAESAARIENKDATLVDELRRITGVYKTNKFIKHTNWLYTMYEKDLSDGIHANKFYLFTEQKGCIPVVLFTKNGVTPTGGAIFVSSKGKAELIKHSEWLLHELNEGKAVLAADVFLTGEMNHPYVRTGRYVSYGRHFPAFNLTDTAMQCSDYVSLVNYMVENYGEELDIYAHGKMAYCAAATLPFTGKLGTLTLNKEYTVLAEDEDYVDNFCLPLYLGFGGFEASAAFGASLPKTITIVGMEDDMTKAIKKYRA